MKETMQHRKNSFDDKKERYHNKRFAGLLQERFQYSSKFLRFYQWKNKIFEEAEVLLLLELHNGMLQMRAAHRAENSI